MYILKIHKMNIILRGHIRNSFDNKLLYEFIKKIYMNEPNLSIYIHTWNIVQNNISWRNDLKNNLNSVTETLILNYFGDLVPLIKHIIIDDDKNIKINGKTSGNVSSGGMPLIGWKNYWYGKYKILEYLIGEKKENLSEFTVTMRFDLFTKKVYSNLPHNIDDTFNFVIKHKTDIIDKNIFIFEKEECNIDNIYVGSISSLYKLASKFHYDMDDILIQLGNIHNHEKYVYFVNKLI